jgi:ATP-dependent Zn protease
MGLFVELLKQYVSMNKKDEVDLGIVSDFSTRDRILTRDALAAVSLDEAGVFLGAGEITVLVCEEGLPQKHVANFLREIGLPSAGRASDAAHRPNSYYIHEGELKLDRWGSSEWWGEAWQQGAGVVFVCKDKSDIEPKVLKKANHVHDLRGEFGDAAAHVIALVCGVDVSEVPDSDYLGYANWYDIYACLRPGMTPKKVIDQISGSLRIAEEISGLEASLDMIDAICKEQTKKDEKPKLRLRDLSGYGAAKDWGMQLAADIADYKAGRLDWSDMDKGCMLSGPPGVGKSYYARALAEECGVPLVMCSYADIEAQTGERNLTNKTIKKIWADARKQAPCIVWMDEFDSLGIRGEKGRNNGWFETIINGLLAEMDGAEPRDGVVVVAATNYPDRVDPAMLRPGRLERHIEIPRPTIDDLPGIIRHHMPDGTDFSGLKKAAVACRGRSPAEIAMASREARRAARKEKRDVTLTDLVAAVNAGRAKMTPEDEGILSIHEAGHAVAGILVGNTVNYVDMSDMQTHSAFGTMFPKEEQIGGLVMATLAGRAAEEVFFGSACSGSMEDLREATETVRRMLTQYGYGRSRAHVSDSDFRIRRDLVQSVEERVDEMYHRTVDLVRRHKAEILRVAAVLRRDRYMTGDDVWRVMAGVSIIRRQWPEQTFSAPNDNERGRRDNRCRIQWKDAA